MVMVGEGWGGVADRRREATKRWPMSEGLADQALQQAACAGTKGKASAPPSSLRGI